MAEPQQRPCPQKVLAFVKHPSVQHLTWQQKKEFLQKKGVETQVIDQALTQTQQTSAFAKNALKLGAVALTGTIAASVAMQAAETNQQNKQQAEDQFAHVSDTLASLHQRMSKLETEMRSTLRTLRDSKLSESSPDPSSVDFPAQSPALSPLKEQEVSKVEVGDEVFEY